MAGTAIGGNKAYEKNIASDPQFYVKIGQRGGIAYHSKPRGFAFMTHAQASAAGRKGGLRSRRNVKYMVRYDNGNDVREMTIQQCADELQLSKAWVAELARHEDNKYGLTLLQHKRNMKV